MTFTPIPNGVRIVHLGLIGGRQIVNTVGCQNGAGGALGASLDDLAASHGSAWRSKVIPAMPAQYSHVNTLAYSLEDASLAPGDAHLSAAVPGAISSTPMPGQACFVASLKTAKRGRTYQGRMYIGPVWATALADDVTFGASAVTLVQNALNDYKAQVDPTTGDNGRMAICSKGSPVNSIPAHCEPVTSILVHSYIGTQRRRVN